MTGHTLIGEIGALVCALVCTAALLHGRAPERDAGGSYFLGTIITFAGQDRFSWLDPQRRLLAIDLILLVIFAVLASIYPRRWLIVATAAQILSVATHFLLLYNNQVRERAYLTTLIVLSYIILATLAYGTRQVASLRRANAAY